MKRTAINGHVETSWAAGMLVTTLLVVAVTVCLGWRDASAQSGASIAFLGCSAEVTDITMTDISEFVVVLSTSHGPDKQTVPLGVSCAKALLIYLEDFWFIETEVVVPTLGGVTPASAFYRLLCTTGPVPGASCQTP